MTVKPVMFLILLGAFSRIHADPGGRVQRGAFEVIGIAGRTTNIDEAGPNGVIRRFWQRLMNDKLLDAIPNRIDTDTIAVYTEYSSDENGAYTYELGARVKPGTPAPEGMRVINVPASTYDVFATARGPVEKVVPAIWQVIWNAFPPDGKVRRAFQTDFELYGTAAADRKNAQVDVYIGVR